MKPCLSYVATSNSVENTGDRCTISSGEHSGDRDRTEAKRFREQVLLPSGLFELQQEEFTRRGGTSFSRLDRVYTNIHVADQLDRILICDAMPWCPHLSDHRPVRFARTRSSRKHSASKNLAPWTIDHEHWSAWVWEGYTRRTGVCNEVDPFAALQVLKDAMHEASQRVRRSWETVLATTLSSQLNATMSFLRAAEMRNTFTAKRCAEAFPKLAEIADPSDTDLRLKTAMEKVRDLAVELATQEALQRQDALAHGANNFPEEVKRTRR